MIARMHPTTTAAIMAFVAVFETVVLVVALKSYVDW